MSWRKFTITLAILFSFFSGAWYYWFHKPLVKSEVSENFAARKIFQKAMASYNNGNKETAASLLAQAGAMGCVGANWKLAHMYAEGDGVKKDALQAYKLFLKIISKGVEFASADEAYLSDALVQLGSYLMHGIEAKTPIKKNLYLARRCFFQAAANYRNPEAQYLLGKMLLEGAGGPPDKVEAVRWFHLAARKGNAHAQYFLAEMLFSTGKWHRAERLLNKAFGYKVFCKNGPISLLYWQTLIFVPIAYEGTYLKQASF